MYGNGTEMALTPTYTPPTLVVAASNSPVNQGSAINLTASSIGGSGTPPATYAWSGPNEFSSTLQNPSIASAAN